MEKGIYFLCFVLAVSTLCCGSPRPIKEDTAGRPTAPAPNDRTTERQPATAAALPPGYDRHTAPVSYENMELVWSDEFNGEKLDEHNWNFEIGDGCPKICGWGNNQLQYYTRENTRVAEGILTITAREESRNGYDYTSSRIQSYGKRMFRFGRIDIRAKLPRGQGIWPALWMLGANRYTAGWPACGEIDIIELAGNKPEEIQGAIHFKTTDGRGSSKDFFTLPEGAFSDHFHLFSLIWEKDRIEWLVDGVKFHEVNREAVEAEAYPFNEEFYFILNVAVGGNWRAGNPDATTEFPQVMEVDYVRVFQEKGPEK